MSYRRRWGECRRDFRSIWYIIDAGKLEGERKSRCKVLTHTGVPVGCPSLVKPFGRFDQILLDHWIQPWVRRLASCDGSFFPHVGCCIVSFAVRSEKDIWNSFLNSKQNKIRSLKLVGFIVEGLMPIGSEEDPEDVDEDSPSRVSSNYFFLTHPMLTHTL